MVVVDALAPFQLAVGFMTIYEIPQRALPCAKAQGTTNITRRMFPDAR